MTDMPAYTRDEWDERARSLIRSTQADASGVRNADMTVGGDYDLWARLIGSVGFMLQEAGRSALRALDKRQSFGAFLRQHASNAAIGATLLETTQVAQRARGKVAVTASTTATQTLATAAVLRSADGTEYTVDAGVSTGTWAAMSFTVGERCTRRMLFHGEQFVATDPSGKIFESAATSELFAARAGGGIGLFYTNPYHYCEAHAPLVDDPVYGDVFTRVPGVIVDVTAVLAGSSGNREPRDALTMSPWSGTFNAAQVLWIDGGRDALTPAQMQEAIRSLYGTRLEVMTLEQIRRLAFDTPRVDLSEVFIFPSALPTSSSGEMTVLPISNRRSLATQGSAVASYLSDRMPPTETVNHLGVTCAAVDWLVTARVSPDFAPDWKFNPYFTQIFSNANTTTRLDFVSSLPTPLLSVGDRVLVSLSRGGSSDSDSCLVERTVSAVGATYIDVDPPLPFSSNYAIVSQSGPFGQDFMTALEQFFDNQAPHIADQYRYPSPDSVSAVQAFQAAISRVPGFVDVVVTEPSGAVVLVDLEVLYPARITLRVWT